jgi:hypothetical protein
MLIAMLLLLVQKLADRHKGFINFGAGEFKIGLIFIFK